MFFEEFWGFCEFQPWFHFFSLIAVEIFEKVNSARFPTFNKWRRPLSLTLARVEIFFSLKFLFDMLLFSGGAQTNSLRQKKVRKFEISKEKNAGNMF